MAHYSETITIEQIKSKIVISKIEELRDKYFTQDVYERGGILILNKHDIVVHESHHYDEEDGMILYPTEMLDNIDDNREIMWHTHNVNRAHYGYKHDKFKCEPPSGADIYILLQLANDKNKYPLGMAIHDNGFWIYRLNKKLTQNQKDHIDEFSGWCAWVVNTVCDIYCNPDPNIINNYHRDDLDKLGITKISSLSEYYETINRIFKDLIFTEYIPF